MRKINLVLLLVLSCCSIKKKDNIGLIVEVASSYKYNFIDETYTIFHLSKSPQIIKFKLTAEEKKEISEKYYELGLDELPQNLEVKDNCDIMPKLFTSISIIKKDKLRTIKIDRGCDDFKFYNKKKALKIKEFLDFLLNILNSRNEIKNAPKSDIIYI